MNTSDTGPLRLRPRLLIAIAATAQTSDVAVTTRAMRKLVIAHGVLSFAFNTMVLALAINMAASQF